MHNENTTANSIHGYKHAADNSEIVHEQNIECITLEDESKIMTKEREHSKENTTPNIEMTRHEYHLLYDRR